jgi:hypothetical protein
MKGAVRRPLFPFINSTTLTLTSRTKYRHKDTKIRKQPLTHPALAHALVSAGRRRIKSDKSRITADFSMISSSLNCECMALEFIRFYHMLIRFFRV